MFPNYTIFVIWKPWLTEKFSVYFLLSMTHSTVWAKTTALGMQFKQKSYPSRGNIPGKMAFFDRIIQNIVFPCTVFG